MVKKFAWAGDTYGEIISGSLSAPMPRGRGNLFYRSMPDYLSSPLVNGKHHIVFISYYNTPAVCKKSNILRQSGQFYTTFLGCCVRKDTKAMDFFDQVYEVEHYQEMMEILETANPSVISATIHPWMTGALALEAKRHKFSGKFILDVNDFVIFTSQDPSSTDCNIERLLLSFADGFTHKLPPVAVEELREKWDVHIPDFMLHSLPCEEYFEDNAMGFAPPYRLVYAGGVMAPEIALKRGHENHIFDPIIQGTADMDIDLTFYVNQNARDMFWEEQQRYFDLEQRCGHFKFNKGVPFFKLPREISDNHFGILYDNISLSSYHPNAYRHNMSTKFFSYLEAGLPILVYDDFEYIADIVRSNDIGLVYDVNKIDEIEHLLRSADYNTLKENVRSFRKRNSINARMDEFVNAFLFNVASPINDLKKAG